MPLSIRAAEPEDVSLILQLIRELAEYEKLLDRVVATDTLLHEALFGATPRAEVLIAEVDGQTAGFALYFHNFSTFVGRAGLYLEDLFVRPQFRKFGIGKALLTHLAKLALARGCGRFEWAVLDWNEPAIGFYKKLGATAQDDWTVFRVDGEALQRLAAM
jgi:GNAT superfamily N-acetyltransferase